MTDKDKKFYRKIQEILAQDYIEEPDPEGDKIVYILEKYGWDGLSKYYGKDVKPIEVKMWEKEHGRIE